MALRLVAVNASGVRLNHCPGASALDWTLVVGTIIEVYRHLLLYKYYLYTYMVQSMVYVSYIYRPEAFIAINI